MPSNCLRYLPADVPAGHVRACLGVLSDTHMPERCAALPATLPQVFDGVDLILHAGDLGELWVLDEIGRIAPVVAVHGNDDTPGAQRELPAQQIIAAHEQRIVLCHSHHPDRAQEILSRRDDSWGPKLEARLEVGRRLGASVVVFGHTHIPMSYRQDGLLLLNPGAIASGSATTRQRRVTVALLYLLDDRSLRTAHVDLAKPGAVFEPDIRWEAGFRAALDRFSATIIDRELAPDWPALEAILRTWMDDAAHADAFDALYRSLLRVAHRCWAGEQEYITRADVLHTLDDLAATSRLLPADLTELRASLGR